jgi:hypothetical protein
VLEQMMSTTTASRDLACCDPSWLLITDTGIVYMLDMVISVIILQQGQHSVSITDYFAVEMRQKRCTSLTPYSSPSTTLAAAHRRAHHHHIYSSPPDNLVTTTLFKQAASQQRAHSRASNNLCSSCPLPTVSGTPLRRIVDTTNPAAVR